MIKPRITFIRDYWWHVSGIGHVWSFSLACQMASAKYARSGSVRSMILYRITLPYACGGIITDEAETVIESAPIFKWMIGKTLPVCRNWVIRKRGTIDQVA